MTKNNWHWEEKAKFKIGSAFYRSESKLARDLGVLAAKLYKLDRGIVRVVDGMSGCGVRSLRYYRESGADYVWANDANPDLREILADNLREMIAAGLCRASSMDVKRLFLDCYCRRDYYDLVDIDSFGSPVPFLNTALWATKLDGLIYVTSTDGRTVTGHLPEGSLKLYNAYARSHPASHEQGLRILLGTIQQRAATMGLGIEPVFSLFFGESYRVMVRLVSPSALSSANYGFLGYCHSCGDYQIVSWQGLGRVCCAQDGKPLTISGPMWLGKLHDREQLAKMALLAEEWGWSKRVELLREMEAEADFPPYFYTLREIGKRGRMNTPKRDNLLQALQEQGYHASSTHINPQAIKTDANLATCIHISDRLNKSLSPWRF